MMLDTLTSNKRQFIVIDDNKLDCFIAEKIILNTGMSEVINIFLDAREALEFISNESFPARPYLNIIIVDIQMPLMNGFEFVEAFEQLPHELKKNYAIFVLSSSINQNDVNRVQNYSSVKDLLNKPLTSQKLVSLVEQLGR